jgi:hypothetical protein
MLCALLHATCDGHELQGLCSLLLLLLLLELLLLTGLLAALRVARQVAGCIVATTARPAVSWSR